MTRTFRSLLGRASKASRPSVWICTYASVLLGLVVAVPARDAVALTADSTKVYRSARGEEVVVVLLKPQSDGKAVIRVTGTSSPLDGMALIYKRSIDGNREYFSTDWHGRRFSFVQVDRSQDELWVLYVPGDLRRAHPIAYDESLTKALQVTAVLSLHESQVKDGSIERFSAFNRGQEQASHEKALADNAAETEKACGAPIPFRMNWSTVSDEAMKSHSVTSYCAVPLAAMASLCKASPVAGAILREKVKELRCGFSVSMKLALTAGTLEWSVDPQASHQEDFAKQNLEAIEVTAPASGRGGEQPPWGDAHTLGQRVLRAQTGVCTDGKNHYVVSAPRTFPGGYLYYGDGKQLTSVQLAGAPGRGLFFEPRHYDPTGNPNFRGHDLRVFSSVDFDEEKQTCSVRCGTRRTDLKLLPAAAAAELLAAYALMPPRKQYVPHALTRDDSGSYYYVDKGSTAETAKQFRLFVGPKGNMKLQRMTNVVSDSQGEIFSTKQGDLRFIVGPQGRRSTWVKGASRIELLAVPIEENWNMIWNDLGVYAGERRGTPCDDL